MSRWEEIYKLISEVTCEPFVFHFSCIDCVRTGDGFYHCDNLYHVWYVQAKVWRKDTTTDKFEWGAGSKRFISPHATNGEIVKSCFVVARDFAEHEVREAFQWKGRRILGPHLDIDALWSVADTLEVRSNEKVSTKS